MAGRNDRAVGESAAGGATLFWRTASPVLIAALVVKLLVLWAASQHPEQMRSRDTASYAQPARSLLASGSLLAESDGVKRPDTLRTPGYPVFLAVVYGLFGHRPAAVAAAQSLLAMITLVMICWLAHKLWGTREAFLAAGLLALDVLSLGYSMMLLTESLFTVLFVAYAVSLLRWHRGPTMANAALCGLFLALATLVRPVSYYLIVPCLVGFLFWARLRGMCWRAVGAGSFAFVLPCVVLVGGWQLRNQRVSGSAQLSRIESVNLLFFRGAAVLAHHEGISLEAARDRLGRGRYRELHPETRDWSPEQLGRRWRREGLELIVSHPWSAVVVGVRGLVNLFLGPGDGPLAEVLGLEPSGSEAAPVSPRAGPLGDLLRLSPREYWQRWVTGNPGAFWLFAFALSHMLLLYCGTLGFVTSNGAAGQDLPFHLALWALGLGLVILSAGPEAYYRFRVPLSPLLSLYGSAGWFNLVDMWRGGRRGA